MNIKTANILTANENIIVHQVNELGVMGAGLALQIKNKYPQVFKQYKECCYKTQPWGTVQIIKIAENKYIGNLFSQKGISRYHQTTNYDLMKQALAHLNEYASNNNLTIAIPYNMGCGLAGGNWTIVSKLIEDTLTVPYTIYKLK